MMPKLKRFFNVVKKEPEMAQEETQASVLAVDRTAELELAQASLTDVQNKLAALQTSFEDISAKHEQSQIALAAVEASKDQMIADAKGVQLSTRLGQLSVVIGDIKAAELNTKLADADDATFATVMSSLALSYELEAKSAAFTEQGVAAASAEVKPVHFNTFINKK